MVYKRLKSTTQLSWVLGITWNVSKIVLQFLFASSKGKNKPTANPNLSSFLVISLSYHSRVPACMKLLSVLVQALFSSLQWTIGFEHYSAKQEEFTGIFIVVK